LSVAFAEAGRRWREERLRLFVVGARVCARNDFDWCTGEQISQSALGIVTSLDEDPDFCFVRWAPLGGAPGSICAALGPAGADWYSVSISAGVVSLTVQGPGDTLLSVGQASGNTCTPSLTGLRAVQLLSASAQRLCVVVVSPSLAPQPYVIVRL
jgi:hypothetical protein